MQLSRGFVLLSFLGNALLALLKFLAWGITGNASMLALSQQALGTISTHLLLWGDDPEEPSAAGGTGTPSSRFFFSFVLTVVILGILAVAAIRHGQGFLGTPYREVSVTFNYLVLAGALLFQTGLLIQTGRRLSATNTSPRDLISRGFEDGEEAAAGTALLEQTLTAFGIVIAFFGVFLTDITGNATFDALAAILIGFVILSLLALLTWGTRTYVLGDRE